MNRITLNLNDHLTNQLEWLCKQAMRRPSNMVSVLISQEVDRQFQNLSDEERAEALKTFADSRTVAES